MLINDKVKGFLTNWIENDKREQLQSPRGVGRVWGARVSVQTQLEDVSGIALSRPTIERCLCLLASLVS